MTTKQLHAALLSGTVSHGTLRRQDLIPVFLDVLAIADSTAYDQLMVSNAGIPAYVADEGDNSDWWDSDDAAYLLEDLFDALDAASPEGYYFGAIEGDGSDFGYWPIDGEI